jgi:hypothetical protein
MLVELIGHLLAVDPTYPSRLGLKILKWESYSQLTGDKRLLTATFILLATNKIEYHKIRQK